MRYTRDTQYTQHAKYLHCEYAICGRGECAIVFICACMCVWVYCECSKYFVLMLHFRKRKFITSASIFFPFCCFLFCVNFSCVYSFGMCACALFFHSLSSLTTSFVVVAVVYCSSLWVIAAGWKFEAKRKRKKIYLKIEKWSCVSTKSSLSLSLCLSYACYMIHIEYVFRHRSLIKHKAYAQAN